MPLLSLWIAVASLPGSPPHPPWHESWLLITRDEKSSIIMNHRSWDHHPAAQVMMIDDSVHQWLINDIINHPEVISHHSSFSTTTASHSPFALRRLFSGQCAAIGRHLKLWRWKDAAGWWFEYESACSFGANANQLNSKFLWRRLFSMWASSKNALFGRTWASAQTALGWGASRGMGLGGLLENSRRLDIVGLCWSRTHYTHHSHPWNPQTLWSSSFDQQLRNLNYPIMGDRHELAWWSYWNAWPSQTFGFEERKFEDSFFPRFIKVTKFGIGM